MLTDENILLPQTVQILAAHFFDYLQYTKLAPVHSSDLPMRPNLVSRSVLLLSCERLDHL